MMRLTEIWWAYLPIWVLGLCCLGAVAGALLMRCDLARQNRRTKEAYMKEYMRKRRNPQSRTKQDA